MSVADEKIEAAIAYAHDVGFDEGYEAAMEEGHMTYALCDNGACSNHGDGGCTLDAASLRAEREGMLVCLDYRDAAIGCVQIGEGI